MKRFTLSLFSLCLVLLGWAESVSKQAALYTAQSYMLAKGKMVSSRPTSNGGRRLSSTMEQEEDQPYYYVFNAEGGEGYVIVSADDRVEPVLGYVEHGSFDADNLPDNMRYWLESYTEEMKYIIDNDIQPTAPALKRRSKVSATKHCVPEILTTRWNQGLPYNLTIPMYYKENGSQERPSTGCIATAWAQVINFHKYPEKIKTQIPSYSKTYTLVNGQKETVTYAAIPKNTPIDWKNMRDTYSCSEGHAHTAQDTAVANLMRYCGYAVKMSYGASSSANWRYQDVVKYFGFDDCAQRIVRDNYGIDEWEDVLYNEIAEGYPIAFSALKIGGGHAFVLDGFDGDGLFHVNWGWGGSGNGWFRVGILNRWNRNQVAIINLRRPDNIRAEPTASLSVHDVIINGTSIKATWENNTGSTGNYNIGIVRLNDDGTLSPVGTTQSITGMANDATQTKTIQLLKKLPEGTYKLSPASKLSSGRVWRAGYNMRNEYIEAVVGADSVPSMRIISPAQDISIDTIVFSTLRIVNQEQKIMVTFRNDGDEFYHDVFLFASKTKQKVYKDYMYRVAAHKGETVTCPFYFTPEETGTYNLWFCMEKDGSKEIGRGTMEVITEAEATKANLAVTYTISNGSNNIAYGKRLIGMANIKNNAEEAYHGSVELELWHQKGGSGSAVSGPSVTYDLDIPAGRTVSVDFEFDNLAVGYAYRFKARYGNQSGNLSGGGVWDFRCDMQEGVLIWKNDGSVEGKAYSSSVSLPTNVSATFADCESITRMMPNRNPNVIYAFSDGMAVPASLSSSNVVSGKHASHINMVSGQPYYIPVTFEADSASFTYTFPETEAGTGWHAFTMPFAVDSVFVDDLPVNLEETEHFWVYEFSAQGDEGEVIFGPATVLRGGTPYIIAGDAEMAGRSVVFRSTGVTFYKTGSDKMLVTSPDYKFHGSPIVSKVKECYVLNNEGTAFDYVTFVKTLPALSCYFSTDLPEELRLPSIVLPEIPKAPVLQGDLNGDGTVDIADGVFILTIMAGEETEEGLRQGDLNKDGKVDIADFVSILIIMAGM